MNRFFCLETEWDKSIQGLKKKSAAMSLLEFLDINQPMNSFVFELWLLNAIATFPRYTAKGIMSKAMQEMPTYVKRFGFVAY